MHPKAIQELIYEFKKLPTVGQRTAERYVYHLLKKGKGDVLLLEKNLNNTLKEIKSCQKCWDFTSTDPCSICLDKNRNHKKICVIDSPQQKNAIEKTKEYTGIYHIIRELLDLTDQNSLSKTKIPELFKRAETEGIEEIILAFNMDMDGETTAMYIQKEIKKINPNIKVTRLARGLPMGSDLQYADEITLGSAIKNRL